MELFKLLGTIAINNSEANKAIDDTTGKGEQAQSKLSASFEKIGGAAVKVGAVMAKGVAVGASAISALTGMAVKSYAEYEQLVGGVETLFGTQGMSINEYAISVGKSVDQVGAEYNRLKMAQDWVMNNASEAYKTAGMSANEYMETVTSFSAALISSLGGDTVKAAEKADQAIIDMSDNANKMGSSMESIRNAYQGFAKQNYTMLDNLKLGYGGTNEEMKRLLADATAISGVEYDMSSYADVVEAIHVIQTEMGITGTTAREASETISGSGAAMKAAWQNLVTGMADENADVEQLIDNLLTSAGAFAKNIIPRIQQALNGIGNAIQKALPKILEKIPSLLKEFVPQLLETTLQMLGTIGTAIVEKLPGMVSDILQTIASLFDANSFLGGFFSSISSMWDAFVNLGKAMTENGDFSKAFSAIGETFDFVWQSLIKPVFDGITSGINWLAENWGTISADISATFEGLWSVCQSVWANIGQPIWDMIVFAAEKVQGLFAEHMPAIKAFFQDTVSGIKDSWNNHLKPALDAIGDFLNTVLKPAFEYVFDVFIKPLVENVFEGIKELWEGSLKPAFDGICDFLLGVFTLDFEKAFNGLKDIVEGCYNYIQTLTETVFGTIKDTITGAIDKIKEFFGFAKDAEEVEIHESATGESHGGGGATRGSSASNASVGYQASDVSFRSLTPFGTNLATESNASGGESFLLAFERIIDFQTEALAGAIMALQESGTIKLDDPYKLFKLIKDQQRKANLATRG